MKTIPKPQSPFAAALLVVLAGTCGLAHADPPMTVPELLADPAHAEGRVVAVEGYLRPHVLYLFPSRELAEAQDWRSALIVGDEPSGAIRDSACPGRVVEMTGTFRQLDPGIYGLTEISLVRLAGGDVCWSRDPEAAPDETSVP